MRQKWTDINGMVIFKMVNRSHIQRPGKLQLLADKFIRLTFDKRVRRDMRSLWVRKKITDPNLETLGDFYEQAFTEYLNDVKIPKQVVKISRETTKLKVSERCTELVKGLQRIAYKRQQPLAVIVEECLQRYLDKPENYLGKEHHVKDQLERLG